MLYGLWACWYLLDRLLPPHFGYDWRVLVAAAEAWRDPYVVAKFYSPPWAALAIAAIQPFGYAGLLVLNLAALAALVRRLGGGLPETALALLSPPVANLIMNGNVDGLVLAGLVLPLPLGLVLLSMKPQAAGWAAVYLWARHPQRGRALVPFGLVALASLAVWGWWPARMLARTPVAGSWNVAPWPWLVPVGVWLLAEAWRRDDWGLALIGNVFLWPYWGFYSLVGAMAVLVVKLRWQLGLVAVVAWWVAIVAWGV